jgi:GntR family transcriptional repressor for pyruvate dehydrogenase complex
MTRSSVEIPWPAPFRASKLSDAVFEYFLNLITSGALPAGSRLPSERETAERLHVSRNCVREVMHELEIKRLVERKPGRGTTVLEVEPNGFQGSLDLLSAQQRDLAEIMDFRLAVEPPIAALAAVRTSRGHLKSMQSLISAAVATDNADKFAQLDQEFHLSIAMASENRLLIRLVDLNASWMAQSRAAAHRSSQRRAASLEGHQDIYEAIAMHDPDAAREKMAEHIVQVRRIIGLHAEPPTNRGDTA